MEVIIQEAKPSDAAQIIAYINRLSEEPNSNIELSPGEFSRTVEEEAGFLADFAASENSIFLVAENAGKIVGIINCRGDSRKAIRHAVTLGMSVDQAWRGKGIGNQLMARAIEWAKSTGNIKRIELSAFERNETAKMITPSSPKSLSPSAPAPVPFLCQSLPCSRTTAG